MRLHRRALRFPGELAKLPKSVKIISLVVFIYYLGWGIAEPFLPIYFKQIFENYTSVGFVTGLLYILSLLWTLPIGDLTDKISKKKFIGLILFLYAPIGPLLLVLKNFFDFVLFRVYHSFLASSLWTCSEAYVREHSPKNKTAEAIGLFDTSSNISLNMLLC